MVEDLELKILLRSWHVDMRPSPRFSHDVWLRIAWEREHLWTWRFKRTREWLAGALTRPAIAPVLVAILALAGTFIAHKQADVRERRHNALMREHYIESVDPVAMAARIAGIRP